MKKYFVLFCLLGTFPYMAQARVKVRACGKLALLNSSHTSFDNVGSGYLMRVDCSKNGKLENNEKAVYNFADPYALATPGVKNQKASVAGRKGSITRWMRGSSANHFKRRFQTPLVCMTLVASADACHSTHQTAQVESTEKMCVKSKKGCQAEVVAEVIR